MTFRPKYITFDCYGTLTRFRMGDMAREMFADRIPAERMEQFIADFTAYRFDEVLGDWQPYEVVLKNAVRRLCRKWKLQYLDAEAQQYYDAVPTWGPHDDVPAGLAKVAKEIPLVILSNAWTTRSRRTSPSSARRSTASTRRSRRRPTSRGCRPSSTCSTRWAATPRTCCTSRPACATT